MSRNIMLLVSAMGSGGAERVAATLVNAWAERSDTVTLVPTFSGRGECFYPVSDRVQLVYLADVAGIVGRTPIAYGARFLALRRLIRETRPDVVVSFLTNVNIAAILATWGLEVPVIVCERINPQFEEDFGRGLRWLRRLIYPLADAVTVQGHDMVPTFRALVPGMKQVVVIPNPLPEMVNQEQEKPAAGKANSPRLIAMGRLSQQKQFSGLIASFGMLAVEFPDWELWIWGEGLMRPQLEQQVRNTGLTGRVFLPGTTTKPREELTKGAVFVLSSAYEGFPNVLLEAMALGLPCVAFDCPSGPRTLTRDGQDGLLVPVDDWSALTAALRWVMGDAALRLELGKRAAVSVRERYTLDKILPLWDALFVNVISQRNGVQ